MKLITVHVTIGKEKSLTFYTFKDIDFIRIKNNKLYLTVEEGSLTISEEQIKNLIDQFNSPFENEEIVK